MEGNCFRRKNHRTEYPSHPRHDRKTVRNRLAAAWHSSYGHHGGGESHCPGGISLDHAMDFSRHAKIDTILKYHDRERNVCGKIARSVSETISPLKLPENSILPMEDQVHTDRYKIVDFIPPKVYKIPIGNFFR